MYIAILKLIIENNLKHLLMLVTATGISDYLEKNMPNP